MDEERAQEAGQQAGQSEEKTDREEGGPTSADQPSEEDATGCAHGTRP